jgi:hypothetical protein
MNFIWSIVTFIATLLFIIFIGTWLLGWSSEMKCAKDCKLIINTNYNINTFDRCVELFEWEFCIGGLKNTFFAFVKPIDQKSSGWFY